MVADQFPMTADTPAASKDGKAMPAKPGYYWAKWRIAADGTHEGDELTPSNYWEMVEVNDNGGEPGSNEQFSVAVPGVRETQWPDCFVWGDFVAPLAGIEKAHPPSAAAHVDALTAQLEAERAKWADAALQHANDSIEKLDKIADLRTRLSAETARADKAEAEAKAAIGELERLKLAAVMLLSNDGAGMGDYNAGGALTGRWLLAIRAGYRTMEQAPAALQSILRATLAQPAADGGK